MLKIISRIRLDIIRLPMLCATFPFYFVIFIISALFPEKFGGLPNKKKAFGT